MRLRPAETADEGLILGWANDPVTRGASFQPDLIAPDEHRRWFARRLAAPESSRIWIGVEDSRAIGIVRIEAAPDRALVVGITVDEAERGRGHSRPLLEAGLAAARVAFPGARFRAWIRADNYRSIALFKSVGFNKPASRPAAPPGAGPDAIVLESD
ncbi:MAG: GNAT family N-acetyltransferase [Candidatus Limnocylindrales bacterium]